MALTCAVIVTYRPDRQRLERLLDRLRPQVDRLVIVDNDSGADCLGWLRAWVDGQISLQACAANLGLAEALNQGIDWAGKQGAECILTLDQDSIPEPNLVARLRAALNEAKTHGWKVAAVGANSFDPRTGEVGRFVRFRWPRSADGERIVLTDCILQKTDFLITSGCLFDRAALAQVGGMNADLFIDNVDLDWSFRATAQGYALFGLADAMIDHTIGDRCQRIALCGLPWVIRIHSPKRLYYMMRNRVWLYRQRYTPRVWIALDVLRLPVKFVLFSLLIAPRLQNFKAMSRGLGQGLFRSSANRDG